MRFQVVVLCPHCLERSVLINISAAPDRDLRIEQSETFANSFPKVYPLSAANDFQGTPCTPLLWTFPLLLLGSDLTNRISNFQNSD